MAMRLCALVFCYDTATTEIYTYLHTLSLHDALPISVDCLANAHAGTVELRYLKRRARGAEHKSMRIRDGGGGTPGGLIRRLIDVTAAAREHLPGDCLWAYHKEIGRAHV